MKILLFGATGQVGAELHRQLAPLGEVVTTTRSGVLPNGGPCERSDFDAPDTLAPLVDRVGPDIVVNAAAYTAVDRAEDDIDAAYRANAEAPRLLAEACRQRDALLVHYSTDYVFDGRNNRPYREDDAVAPLGVYGESKFAGEQAIRASGARHLIFRTAWVYATHGSNFMRTMLRLAAERDELRVVSDQFGSPTPAGLIAGVTSRVLAQSLARTGTWHLTAAGQASWFQFAQAIMEQAHAVGLLSRLPRLTPLTTDQYPTRATRPGYSVLDCSRLQGDVGIQLPHWPDALGDVLAEVAGRCG